MHSAASREEATAWRKRRLLLRPVSVAVLIVIVAITILGAVLGSALVHDQERRLLDERAAEVNAVLTADVNEVSPSLSSVGDVLSREGTPEAFDRVARSEAAGAGPGVSFAWLKPTAGGFTVLAGDGPGLTAGSVVGGQVAATLSQAAAKPGLVPTPVVGTGKSRMIGFAVGAPVAPPGTVLYRQSALGPLMPTKQRGKAFSDLAVVLYSSPAPDPSQILVETTASVPLHGQTTEEKVPVGTGSWLLQVASTTPLVGSVAAGAAWAIVAAGLVIALLAVSAVEIESRRREVAQALYAGEHDIAETLQRSLLPELPAVGDLDVAARYLAGGAGQQVGGDWFDVFPLAGGRTGVVIGDVMGHDLVAAAAMSQIRASVRAFAWQGHQPDQVLTELDQLVDTFSLAQLVTLFYGTLEPPSDDGHRVLRYANAGHLPPLLRRADGTVEALDQAASVVIGADTGAERAVAEVPVDEGDLLVCFTDGLIEVPGGSLGAALEALAASVTGAAPSADALCSRLLAERRPGPRDDIAVLVVGPRVTASPTGTQTDVTSGTA